jgi:phosphoserine phosphatase
MRAAVLAVALGVLPLRPAGAQDLASWNRGPARAAIEAFVKEVTTPGPAFVEAEDRIAVFDNDGTIWSEQPIYTEFAFSIARAAEMAKADPTLAQQEPYRTLLTGDPAQIAAIDAAGLGKLIAATHSGLTTEEFKAAAKEWLDRAANPKCGRLYRECGYPPMLELIAYLKAHGFKVFIVSGGDVDFMRVFAAEAYGVPADQTIGSSSNTRFEARGDGFVLVREPQMVVDDKAGKPSNIALHVGRRPIFAAGNSDGDLEMLQYVTTGPGRRLGLIVRHDDAQREFAYDRASKVGKLDKALDEAPERGWLVVSMKRDWARVFPARP